VKPLFDHDEAVAKFVASLIPGMERGFSANKAIGIINGDGTLVAGLVYHNWEPEAGIIEISGAAIDSRWMTRPILQLMYDYPFLTCGCQMIVQRNSARNEHLNRQLRRWGYDEFRIPRMKGRDEDGIVFTLTDDQWAAHPMNMRKKKVA
jgi:hypothetical protein